MTSKPVLIIRDGSQTKTHLTPQVITDQYEYKYPSENKGKKPEIEVGRCMDVDKGYNSVLQKFNTGTPSLNDTLSYLVAVLPLIEATLEDDWESYDITIGKKNDKITPLSLLQVKYIQRELNFDFIGQPVTPDNSKKLTLAGLILAIYRLGKIKAAQTGNYRQTLADRIQSILTTTPFSDIITAGVLYTTATTVAPWITNSDFRKIVGAVDMFFMKFEHEYSAMRVGTVVTAYEDCSALSSLTYFINKLGLTPEESVTYFFHPSIVRDLERLWNPGQEIEKSDSYFVHFKALGFSGKSPYSSNAAGYLYNCIHFTGSYLGDPRSLNAAVIDDKAPNEMIVIAAFLGDAFWGTSTYTRQLFLDDNDYEEYKKMMDDMDDFSDAGSVMINDNAEGGGENRSQSRNPQSVYLKIVNEKGVMTRDQKKRFQDVVRRITPRPGSFGQFITNLLSST
ncbi:nucleoprotein [Boana pugnax lyssa-like virus 1]|uniref:Nucleoprotein n=1 Tax=Boana pugnax lyssa-like virus 1 TaxID=2985438 RepID=A0AAE9P6U8_9RHAB|nr:nucleoprotein [Boana pugnax lyssa-like virus 1]